MNFELGIRNFELGGVQKKLLCEGDLPIVL